MSDEFIFDLLQKAVEEGEKTDGVFIDARYDDYQLTSINLTNDVVKESSSKRRRGIGVMAYYKGTPGFSFTPELTVDAVKKATQGAVKLAVSTEPRNKMKLEFDERPAIKDKAILQVKKHPKDFEFTDKLDLLKRGVAAIKENVDATSTQAQYGEFYGEKYFVNSDGSEIFWTPMVVDMIFFRYNSPCGTKSQKRFGKRPWIRQGISSLRRYCCGNKLPNILRHRGF